MTTRPPDDRLPRWITGVLGAFAVLTLLGGCVTYSCGNGTGSHCYGIVTLEAAQNNAPGFRGVATSVIAVALNSGNGELNNEMWVVQPSNSACGSLGTGNQCWIEVGLSAGANAGGCSIPSGETHVFWADNRPNGGFFCHDQGALLPEELNQPVFLAIAIRPTEANTYDVEALTCTSVTGSGSCTKRVIAGTSTNNAMAATLVEIGMELAGSKNASASTTHFTETIFANPNVIFGWTFLNVDGAVSVDAPVKAGWTTTPSTSSSGGSFSTGCCQ
jgi:hypothetical protein